MTSLGVPSLSRRIHICRGSRLCHKAPLPNDTFCRFHRLLTDARAGDEEARRVLAVEHGTRVYSRAKVEAYAAKETT